MSTWGKLLIDLGSRLKRSKYTCEVSSLYRFIVRKCHASWNSKFDQNLHLFYDNINRGVSQIKDTTIELSCKNNAKFKQLIWPWPFDPRTIFVWIFFKVTNGERSRWKLKCDLCPWPLLILRGQKFKSQGQIWSLTASFPHNTFFVLSPLVPFDIQWWCFTHVANELQKQEEPTAFWGPKVKGQGKNWILNIAFFSKPLLNYGLSLLTYNDDTLYMCCHDPKTQKRTIFNFWARLRSKFEFDTWHALLYVNLVPINMTTFKDLEILFTNYQNTQLPFSWYWS